MTMLDEYNQWRNQNINHREDYTYFLQRLNEKYFNGTLVITDDTGKIYVNDMSHLISALDDMEYLDHLYNLNQLESIKHKIERIYGNN